MPDLEISKLPELSGPGLADLDVLPLADLSASETKKITAKNLIQASVALIDDGSIPWDKVNVPSTTIPDGSITTDMLQDGAVTDIKIDSVNGSKIVNGSITTSKFGEVTDRGLDVTTGYIGIANAVATGSHAGISWDSHGLITGATSPIPTADLPIATNSNVGVVKVPTDGGLAISATGEVSIAYTTAPKIVANVAYNEFGQIIYVTELESGHLPIATTNDVGAVKFPLNGDLLVDADGNVTLIATGVSAGAYTKVAVDANGRVTNGALLDPSDIPSLPASKITTGELPTARIANDAITAEKLGDYSTCLIQEDNPGGKAEYFLGMLWFQPSTSSLFVYTRGSGEANMWMRIGLGGLAGQQLRWGGTYDASTGAVDLVTDFGLAAGLQVGGAIPAVDNLLAGIYLLCTTSGNAITVPNLSGIQHDNGDWIVAVSPAQGWIHLDVVDVGGGGGGGGVNMLSQLLDVHIATGGAPALTNDDLLQYDSTSGFWENSADIDGGTY